MWKCKFGVVQYVGYLLSCAGMVGNYNGNVTDDVIFRNGTMVPISEFSFRILHQVGLSCELYNNIIEL